MTDITQQNNMISALLQLLTLQSGTKDKAKNVFQILKKSLSALEMSYYQHFDGKLYLEAYLSENENLILPHYPLKNHNPTLQEQIEKLNLGEGISIYPASEEFHIVTIVSGAEMAGAIHFKSTKQKFELDEYTKTAIALIFFFLDNQKIKEQIKIANRTTRFYLKEKLQKFSANGPFSVYFDMMMEKEVIDPSSQFSAAFQTTPKTSADFIKLIAPSDKEIFTNELQKIKNEENQNGTLIIRIIDGSKLERKVLMVYEKQTYAQYRWWCLDISTSEESTSSNNNTLNTILENIPEALICTDQLGFINYTNKNADLLLGKKLDSLRGLSIEEIFIELNITKIKDLSYSQQNNKLETIVRTENYDHIPVEVSAAENFIDGNIQYYLYISDISAQKEIIERNKILNSTIQSINSSSIEEKNHWQKLRTQVGILIRKINDQSNLPDEIKSTITQIANLENTIKKGQFEKISISELIRANSSKLTILESKSSVGKSFYARTLELNRALKEFFNIGQHASSHQLTQIKLEDQFSTSLISRYQLSFEVPKSELTDGIVEYLYTRKTESTSLPSELIASIEILETLSSENRLNFNIKSVGNIHQFDLDITLYNSDPNGTSSLEEDNLIPRIILEIEHKLLHSEYIDNDHIQKMIGQLKDIDQTLPLLAKLQVHLSDMQYGPAGQVMKEIKKIIRDLK